MNRPVDPTTQPEVWNTVASAYDQYTHGKLPVIMDAIAEKLAVTPSMTVLDIAAGPGALALRLAKRAKRVVAVDFAESMIARLRTHVAESGVTNVEIHQMDANAMTFDDATFDAAGSSFGVFLFADRVHALREMARVVKPGGRVLSSSWAPLDRNEILGVGIEALREAVPDLPRPPGPLPTQRPEVCTAELVEGGFVDVEATFVSTVQSFAGVEEFWDMFAAASPPMAVLARKLGDQAFGAAKARMRAALEKRLGSGPIELRAEAIVTTGTRA